MLEVKYMAMSYGVLERVWIQKFLNELLSEETTKKIEMLRDNKISLTLTKDPESQNGIKCINVIYHHV